MTCNQCPATWESERSYMRCGKPVGHDGVHEGAREVDGEELRMSWCSSVRDRIFVHTDHNPDPVRSFYEIPDELARLVQPEGDPETFAQCLARLVTLIPESEAR